MTQTVCDPLRLLVCPRCGYSLQGLPDEGLCPECGRRYDQRTVVLFGWARGAKATAVTAQPWVAAGLLAMNSVWLVHILAFPGAAARLRVGMILAWAGLIGFILWKRRRAADLPGVIQVHLTEAGCAQVDDPASPPVRPTPWAQVEEVVIRPLSAERCRVQLRRRHRFVRSSLSSGEFVDAEVKCSPGQVEALTGRIEGWRRGDRGGS